MESCWIKREIYRKNKKKERENVDWGKLHEWYKQEFKKHGFILKVELKRHGYRDVSKGGRGGMEDFNDFWIYINDKHNMHYRGISFDHLDCILNGYLNAFRLMQEKVDKLKEAHTISKAFLEEDVEE